MNVLVVEDDPDARAAAVKALNAAGFSVAEAENGLAGLEQACGGRFDAVICDLRLPHLPGGAFYEELRRRDPASARRVVFVSGIAHDPAVRQFLDETGRPYLQKPYDVHQLIEAVRQVAS